MKETNYKTVLKSNIILFLSYGILTGFVFLVVALILAYALQDISNPLLSITLSLIGGILLFYLLHFICKSSTLESFKKNKLSEENATKFLQKMNLFFIICIILSILLGLGYLFVNNLNFTKAIAEAYETYNFISPEFANKVVLRINEEYQTTLPSKVCSTIILELSLVVSFFSLPSYQKKMLTKYNQRDC